MRKQISLLTIPILLFGLCFSSCKNETNIPGLDIETVFFIKYINADGETILHDGSQIEILYDLDGTAVKVERPNLDYPNGYTLKPLGDAIPNGGNDLCLKVFPEGSINYIKLDGYERDTIKCEFLKDSGGITIIKIWQNNKLVWDFYDQTHSTSRLIQITK
jgi:hypothetical protein